MKGLRDLQIKYLGLTQIKNGDNIVKLSYSSAQYVLFYIMIEKQVNRDILSSTIWEDMDEVKAKKNLRNALYTIRQTIGENVLLSPNRNLITINPDFKYESDIDYIKNFNVNLKLSDEEIDNFLNVYSGVFLEGLEVNCSEAFAQWIETTRYNIESEYADKLRKLADLLLNSKNYSNAKRALNKLIAIDHYDEKAYRFLMSLYIEEGNHSKAHDAYIELSKRLYEDLMIQPSPETKEYYVKILNELKKHEGESQYSLYGREREIEIILDNFLEFIRGGETQSTIIRGGLGLGKSSILNIVEDKIKEYRTDSILIRLDNQNYEMKLIFKFWEELLTKGFTYIKENDISFRTDNLANTIKNKMEYDNKDIRDIFFEMSIYEGMKYDVIEKTVYDLIMDISSEKKLILLLDDLDFIDTVSLEILLKALNSKDNNIMIVATYEQKSLFEKNNIYQQLINSGKVKELIVNEFSMEETQTILKNIYPEYAEYYEKIYLESGGNPFYIKEIVELIRAGKININSDVSIPTIEENILKKIGNLDSETQNVLEICSFFRTDIPIKILREVVGLNHTDLIVSVENAISNGLLRESGNQENISLEFVNEKIREVLYNRVSKFKKVLLHEKLGEFYVDLLNKSLTNFFSIYTDIIYHYNNSGNSNNEYKYRIYRLENVLRVPGEIFPEVEDLGEEKTFIYVIDKIVIEEEFEKIENLLNSHISLNDEDLIEEKVIHLYILGSYKKTKGLHDSGNEAIKQMIPIADKNNLYEYVFKAICQVIDLAIFKGEYHVFDEYLVDLERVVKKLNTPFENAYVKRITGYNHLLKGDAPLCRKYQYEAIDILDKTLEKRKYILGYSAIYSNIAESYMEEGNLEEAENYYLISADYLPKAYENIPGAGLMYLRMGRIKYEQELYDEALFYFKKAMNSYEGNNFKWNISEVYYYLSKVYEYQGDTALASQYRKKAKDNIKTCKSQNIIDEL